MPHENPGYRSKLKIFQNGVKIILRLAKSLSAVTMLLDRKRYGRNCAIYDWLKLKPITLWRRYSSHIIQVVLYGLWGGAGRDVGSLVSLLLFTDLTVRAGQGGWDLRVSLQLGNIMCADTHCAVIKRVVLMWVWYFVRCPGFAGKKLGNTELREVYVLIYFPSEYFISSSFWRVSKSATCVSNREVVNIILPVWASLTNCV